MVLCYESAHRTTRIAPSKGRSSIRQHKLYTYKERLVRSSYRYVGVYVGSFLSDSGFEINEFRGEICLFLS